MKPTIHLAPTIAFTIALGAALYGLATDAAPLILLGSGFVALSLLILATTTE